MTSAGTLQTIMQSTRSNDPAIAAPERTPLTYAGLRSLTDQTVAALNQIGVGRGDRVAIVLPNGPEMATAFLTIASGATTAPLNPGYHAEEFDFYLSDLGARALVILEGMACPARDVAAARNIPMVTLVPDMHGPAGAFSLRTEQTVNLTAGQPGFADADDIALVLHTSGTTSRPKLVPLSHRNITASARSIGRVLELSPGDVCLNIMPLFHIHGLIAATLSSIAAGASVNCTPGFNGLRFFQWFDEVRPTWYTAVPSMHQAILARASHHPESLKNHRLRFIRSSSASLPPPVMQALEDSFDVPVVESYGMTEAAHQMASNPLPPSRRYPGSVGITAVRRLASWIRPANFWRRGWWAKS